MAPGILDSFSYVVPEIVLLVAAAGILGFEKLFGEVDRLGDVALAGLALALVAMAVAPHHEHGVLFGGLLYHDPFSGFFKVLLALAGMSVAWMSVGASEIGVARLGRYYALMLLAIFGTFLMAAAAHLIVAYAAVFIVGVAARAFTAFGSPDARDTALTRLVYQVPALGAGALLLAWVTGAVGGLGFADLQAKAVQGDVVSWGLVFAVGASLTGLLAILGAVPLHYWAPAVMHRVPTPAAAFLTAGSFVSGLGLLVRFLYPTLSVTDGSGVWQIAPASLDWRAIGGGIAITSMLVGSGGALLATSLKRLLAFFGVAHVGFALTGLLLLRDEGLEAIMYYCGAYLFTVLGAFAVVGIVVKDGRSDDIAHIRGMASERGILLTGAFLLFLAALSGLPPTSGFFARFYVLSALMREEMYALAIVGVLAMFLSFAASRRVFRAAFADPGTPRPAVRPTTHELTLVLVLSAATVAMGVFSEPFFKFARFSLVFVQG